MAKLIIRDRKTTPRLKRAINDGRADDLEQQLLVLAATGYSASLPTLHVEDSTHILAYALEKGSLECARVIARIMATCTTNAKSWYGVDDSVLPDVQKAGDVEIVKWLATTPIFTLFSQNLTRIMKIENARDANQLEARYQMVKAALDTGLDLQFSRESLFPYAVVDDGTYLIDLPLAKLLLDAGANPNVPWRASGTALDWILTSRRLPEGETRKDGEIIPRSVKDVALQLFSKYPHARATTFPGVSKPDAKELQLAAYQANVDLHDELLKQVPPLQCFRRGKHSHQGESEFTISRAIQSVDVAEDGRNAGLSDFVTMCSADELFDLIKRGFSSVAVIQESLPRMTPLAAACLFSKLRDHGYKFTDREYALFLHNEGSAKEVLAEVPVERLRGLLGDVTNILLAASPAHKISLLELLVHHGFDAAGYRDPAGNTLLHRHLTVLPSDSEFTGALLNHGCDPNARNIAGWTPLMSFAAGPDALHAQHDGEGRVVWLAGASAIRLLDAGADPAIQDGDGKDFDQLLGDLISRIDNPQSPVHAQVTDLKRMLSARDVVGSVQANHVRRRRPGL